MKGDFAKIFLHEIYSKLPERNYETSKIFYNHFDELRSIDSADLIDKISNNKGYRYIFVIIDNFSNCLWAIPFKK